MCKNIGIFSCYEICCIITKHNIITSTKIQLLGNICIEYFWLKEIVHKNIMDDFLLPKIVYPNMTKYLPFVYDDKRHLTNQKCFIITGKNVAFLTAFFNSSLFKFCFRDSFPELQGGTRELSKIFFDKIPVIQVDFPTNEVFEKQLLDIQEEYTKSKAIEIDTMIFDLYNLSKEERQLIGFAEIE